MVTSRQPSHFDTMNLLNQFLNEDATAYVRQQLLDAIDSGLKQNQVKEFTFNRFNVRIDFGRQTVMLEDDLDASDEGKMEISLPVFVKALREDLHGEDKLEQNSRK